jgi:hypothetical protein
MPGSGSGPGAPDVLEVEVRPDGSQAGVAADGRLFAQARRVADAVLYEGYLLYPYRRSSGKNRVRWQFGVLASRPWIEASGPVDESVAGSAESWWQQTECLLEPRSTGDESRAELWVGVRFLQLQDRRVEMPTTEGGHERVDVLELDGARYLSFEEAVPRQVDLEVALADLLDGEQFVPVEVAGGVDIEPVTSAGGRDVGRICRYRESLSARVALSAVRCGTPFPLVRLRIRIENAGLVPGAGASREQALAHSLLATHTMIAGSGVRFVSLIDPPAWADAAARSCRNTHTFPVLVGERGTDDVVLSSPILLYDHPSVAPESPGDLHDAAEIDEILSLRTLTLSEEEKSEVRATDPRAAAILDRVDTMPPEVFERLHGTLRTLNAGILSPATPAQRLPDQPDAEQRWWEPGADVGVSPESDTVLVSGTRLGKGSRVRLRPRRRGGDAHDMFLAGRTARVEKVLLDVDGSRFLAVAVDDDPGADLHQWYGRLRHFRPEEVEPLPDEPGSVR